MNILEVKNLSKHFGNKVAVNNLNFEIKKGQIFGLLGPNGSGKTTTIAMILSLLKPTKGEIKLFESPKLAKGIKRIGVLMESASYYPSLSAYRNLKISCIIKDVSVSEIDSALEKVDLLKDKNFKVKNFSLGMKQRLNLASALLGDPDLLILDEPTNGLDPQGIAEVRNIILQFAKDGKTILIASHLLSEMEKVCTHIAIVKNGDLINQGEIKTLISGYENLEDYFLKTTS